MEMHKKILFLPIAGLLATAGVCSATTHDVNINETEHFEDRLAALEFGFPENTRVAIANIESQDDIISVALGMSSAYESLVNTGEIRLATTHSVALEENLSVSMHIPNFRDLYGAGENWILSDLPYTAENKATLAVECEYGVRQSAVISSIGMAVTGADAVNNDTISHSMQLDADLQTHAEFHSSTGNEKPDESQLTMLEAGQSLLWTVQGYVVSFAWLDIDASLVGMWAEGKLSHSASLTNNGTITIDGHINRSETTSRVVDWDGNESFEVFDSDHSVSVTFEDIVKATTFVTGNTRAVGMWAVAGTLPNASVTLVNNGTIRIATSSEFTAAGMLADVTSGGTVFASNLGIIDLSEADTTHKHQLLAYFGSGESVTVEGSITTTAYSDGSEPDVSLTTTTTTHEGTVVIGDWVLGLGDIEDLVPFAGVSAEGTSLGTFRFAEDATLYLIPQKPEHLQGEFSLGSLFGTYSSDGSTFTETLDNVEGSFATVRALSGMIDVTTSGSDLNHLSVNLEVRPERALGTDLQHKAFASGISSLLSLRALTARHDFNRTEGWNWEATPWVVRGDFDTRDGFDTKGTGVVVRASTTFGGGSATLDFPVTSAPTTKTSTHHSQPLLPRALLPALL